MSKPTQRAAVSPKHLPLPPGQLSASDKGGWLPEGRVFSNVQREKISKFLKGSVLKRVFSSQQMRWEGPGSPKKDSSPTFPDSRKEAGAPPAPAGMLAQQADAGGDSWASSAERAVREQSSGYTKVVRRREDSCDTTLHVPTISQETHLENQVEEVILDLPLSENASNRTQQNHNKRIFQLWTHPDEENTTDNRESLKSSEKTGFSVANSPIKFLTLNHSSTMDSKHAGSYPGLSMPVGLCWPYADGDFLKDRKEFHTDSCSTVKNNNGDSLSAPRWNLKYRNSNVEENVTDESDLSENEKMNDTLLSYFKTMDLNLKPETIENTEEPFTLEPSEIFVYADFLPAPFNTLDLHKFALSKCENWKATVGPPESSIEQLITRLLELERLQHMTIQKERQRPQSTLCPQVVLERPSSSKAAVSKTRQPKPPDTSNPQTSSTEKSREKRKNNCVSGKLEQNASKWNWNSAGKSKLNSRPALKCPSTTKQDDLKTSKSSCQKLPPKPAPAPTTQPPVKMVSTKCIPPRSPMPVSPIPLTFPENQREEVKAPRNKKKLPRKSILLNKPLYIHKLNCLSPSFIKGKCSPIDQK